MKKNFLKLLIVITLFPNYLFANTKYFTEGVSLFNNKKFKEAQFKFEQDIVFNPKSELSYLYLSKIFNKLEKKKTRGTESSNSNVVKSKK